MHLKMYDQANADFEQALSLDSSFTKALYKKAYLMLGKKQFTRSLEYFNSILEIDPEFAKAYLGRAIVYYYLKDYDRSWDEVHKAQHRGLEVNEHFLTTLSKASQNK